MSIIFKGYYSKIKISEKKMSNIVGSELRLRHFLKVI